jgi:kynureninase
LPRFGGWWGNDKATRFQMEKRFQPLPTAEGWQLSCTQVFSMAAHKASLDMFDEAGMENLIAKSQRLSAYLFFLLDEINARQGERIIEIITPRDSNERGCQVSMFMLKKGRETFDELTELGVMADWREPNVIRVAPVPMYNSFEDVWRFGNIIETVLNK